MLPSALSPRRGRRYGYDNDIIGEICTLSLGILQKPKGQEMKHVMSSAPVREWLEWRVEILGNTGRYLV